MGGQWGSEAKGCAAAWVGAELAKQGRYFDIVTTNAGAQAGHTSTHNGKTRVVYHLPTAPLITEDILGKPAGMVYLNAGSIIDPEGLMKELEMWKGDFFIHPMAAIITPECREEEGKIDSNQTKIASTRKGVGQALARKVLRSGIVAKDHPELKQFVRRINLNNHLRNGKTVLVEVPQGVSLSINHSKFYPYCTSRDCTTVSAMSDACIHPHFYGKSMVVFRTYPIRVGNIVDGDRLIGVSGPVFPDQKETTWEELGVKAEITTVTKRIRRVFTFSRQQAIETISICRPDFIFLSFCNYAKGEELDYIIESINLACSMNNLSPTIIYQWGPTTEDAGVNYARQHDQVQLVGGSIPDRTEAATR